MAPQTSQPGKVVFVGAGPGNPDLLTVRAREVLAATSVAVTDPGVLTGVREVVASGLPVPQERIDAAEAEYERICAEAKAAGARRRPPRPPAPTAADIREVVEGDAADVVKQLSEALAEGGDVIRLVTGNPLTRDQTMAEIAAVAAAGLEFQVVPGMSLPSTVPSFAGIALGSTYTETDVTENNVDWEQLASAPQPLVLQATEADLETIATELGERGMAPDTPVSVTVNGTTRLQRTHDVTLGTLGRLDAELPGQLVVTLGKGVDDRTKYSWWENRPLYGWRVLVPRTKEQAASMSARLSGYGAVRRPCRRSRWSRRRNAHRWSVPSRASSRAATSGSCSPPSTPWRPCGRRSSVRSRRRSSPVSASAVGTKTAQAISDLGMTPELLPAVTKQNAAGLVEVFPEYVEDLDPVGRVLLPRADIATDVLVDGLIDLGWQVDDVVAYRTVRAAPPSAEIREMIKSGGFDAVCFPSSSTVKNLVGIAGKPHPRTIIACIGPMTEATAKEMGLRVDVVPEIAEVPELVDALADHVAGLRAAGQLPPPRKKRRTRRKAGEDA